MAVRSERDYKSFVNLGGDDWARRVVGSSGSILADVNYDSALVTYPDLVTEVYNFKIGGLSGTTVAIVTLIYTNSTKKNILSFERT